MGAQLQGRPVGDTGDIDAVLNTPKKSVFSFHVRVKTLRKPSNQNQKSITFFNNICVCIPALADYLKWLIVHQEKNNQTRPMFQSNDAIYDINKIETSNLF